MRTCVGCGRSADAICERCLARVVREGEELVYQFRRLVLRGVAVDQARTMMERRVNRYFKNGTMLPLGRLATD